MMRNGQLLMGIKKRLLMNHNTPDWNLIGYIVKIIAGLGGFVIIAFAWGARNKIEEIEGSIKHTKEEIKKVSEKLEKHALEEEERAEKRADRHEEKLELMMENIVMKGLNKVKVEIKENFRKAVHDIIDIHASQEVAKEFKKRYGEDYDK